jgi:hypothetical protein
LSVAADSHLHGPHALQGSGLSCVLACRSRLRCETSETAI